MSTFKRSFRGYRIDDVNNRLSELDQQLQSATERCSLLEQQLADSKQATESIRQKLSDSNAKLESLTGEYDRVVREKKAEKIDAEKIGRVYLKAFESGREVAMAPNIHVQSYLNEVEAAMQGAQSEIAALKQNFDEAEREMISVIADIQEKINLFKQKLREVSLGIKRMEQSYSGFYRVKTEIQSRIDAIQEKYALQVSDYMDVPTQNRSEKAPISRRLAEREEIVEAPSVAEESNLADVQAAPMVSAGPSDTSSDPAPDLSLSDKSVEPPQPQTSKDFTSEDTYVDFLEENATRAVVNTDVSSTQAHDAETAPFSTNGRGKSILDLLNKYKKQ